MEQYPGLVIVGFNIFNAIEISGKLNSAVIDAPAPRNCRCRRLRVAQSRRFVTAVYPSTLNSRTAKCLLTTAIPSSEYPLRCAPLVLYLIPNRQRRRTRQMLAVLRGYYNNYCWTDTIVSASSITAKPSKHVGECRVLHMNVGSVPNIYAGGFHHCRACSS